VSPSSRRARNRRCERGSTSPARVKLFTPASPVPQAAGLSASAMLIRAGKGRQAGFGFHRAARPSTRGRVGSAVRRGSRMWCTQPRGRPNGFPPSGPLSVPGRRYRRRPYCAAGSWPVRRPSTCWRPVARTRRCSRPSMTQDGAATRLGIDARPAVEFRVARPAFPFPLRPPHFGAQRGSAGRPEPGGAAHQP